MSSTEGLPGEIADTNDCSPQESSNENTSKEKEDDKQAKHEEDEERTNEQQRPLAVGEVDQTIIAEDQIGTHPDQNQELTNDDQRTENESNQVGEVDQTVIAEDQIGTHPDQNQEEEPTNDGTENESNQVEIPSSSDTTHLDQEEKSPTENATPSATVKEAPVIVHEHLGDDQGSVDSNRRSEQPLPTAEENDDNAMKLIKEMDNRECEKDEEKMDTSIPPEDSVDNHDPTDQEMKSQSSTDDPGFSTPEEFDDDEVKKKEEKDMVGGGGATGTGTRSESTQNKNEDDSGGSGDDDKGCWKPWLGWQSRKITLPKLSRYSSYDTEQYRTGYPGKRDDERVNDNYEFYTNRMSSYPNGDYIENIHKKWWGQYAELEYNHSYIQWLFPIRERGMNWHAKELQLHEIKDIIADPAAHERVLTSYKMMLDFYGLELVDKETGEVKRSKNWKDRFDNLNHSGHNYLRITRILKCLGEFNYEHLKPPLIRCFLDEAITNRTLINALNSCMNYWIEVVKDESTRKELRDYAKTLVDEANSKA